MEPVLTAHQIRILAEGIVSGGYMPIERIYKFYASDDAAKNTIMSLESWGYIVMSKKHPGYVAVIKAPDEAYIVADRIKESRNRIKDIEHLTNK